MKLDRHYSVRDDLVKEMAKKPKKEILEWLRGLPVYKGIYIEIREAKLKKLTDDIKQLSPKPAKRKPAANKGTDAKDNSDRSTDKDGED